MRLICAVGRLLASPETAAAIGLLTVAMILSPPNGGGLALAAVLVAAAMVIAAALHALRGSGQAVDGHPGMGIWPRATAALALSASVLMIAAATMAVIA